MPAAGEKVAESRTLAGMDTNPIPDLDAGELRALSVRTRTYVFELVRGADGQTVTTFTPIRETTPDQSAGATENPRSSP